MSNSYTKAAFTLVVTAAEANLLRRVVDAIALIGDPAVGLDALEAHYATIGDDFAAKFRGPTSVRSMACSTSFRTRPIRISISMSRSAIPTLRIG